MTEPGPQDRSFTRVLVGGGLALVLTALSFGLVALHLLAGGAALAVLGGLALVQILIHLHWFLHVDPRKSAPENLAVLGLSAVIIALMVGGTLWIMFVLNARMM